MGVSRSAGRVARSRIVSALAARRLVCARLIGSLVVIAVGLWNQERPFVPGTKGRAFRGATLIRRVPHSRDRRPGVSPGDRRCPVSLALCAGAYWVRPARGRARVRSGGSRVHSLPPSLRFAPATGSLCRRATGTRPVHSPYSYVSGDGGRVRGGRQAAPRDRQQASPGSNRRARTTRQGRIARVRRPSWTARRAGRRCHGSCGPPAVATGPAQPGRRAGPLRRGRGAARAERRRVHAIGADRVAVAERVGFEPTKSFDSALFKSAAINRSATSPGPKDTR